MKVTFLFFIAVYFTAIQSSPCEHLLDDKLYTVCLISYESHHGITYGTTLNTKRIDYSLYIDEVNKFKAAQKLSRDILERTVDISNCLQQEYAIILLFEKLNFTKDIRSVNINKTETDRMYIIDFSKILYDYHPEMILAYLAGKNDVSDPNTKITQKQIKEAIFKEIPYISHQTSKSGLFEILRAGAIRPWVKRSTLQLFDDFFRPEPYSYVQGEIDLDGFSRFLIYLHSSSLMDLNFHWNLGWPFGRYGDGSISSFSSYERIENFLKTLSERRSSKTDVFVPENKANEILTWGDIPVNNETLARIVIAVPDNDDSICRSYLIKIKSIIPTIDDQKIVCFKVTEEKYNQYTSIENRRMTNFQFLKPFSPKRWAARILDVFRYLWSNVSLR